MEIRQIQYFMQLFQDKNMTRASKMLFISQQGLSKSIHALETEIGFPLFNRTPGGVEPTARAIALYEHFAKVNEAFRELNRAVSREANRKKLSVTVPPIVAFSDNVHHLSRYKQKYPEVEVEYKVLDNDTIIERMLSGKYEAAYLGATPPETLTVHRKISISDFCAVVSREHPLAGEKSITPETLARYPLTVIDIFNDYNQYFIRRLKISAGHISKVNILEFPDYICLSGSVGVSIQSVFKRLKTEDVVSIPVIFKAEDHVCIEVSLVTAKGATLSPEVEAFIHNEIDPDNL
ncbi:MAG: LysR family transcriptional regulator [Eubacteriaceae bacterium]|nr:LysR family transcriptional regulator [Eubacteriaceae bacterium]